MEVAAVMIGDVASCPPSLHVGSTYLDTMRIEVPARRLDEPRWLVIGQIDGRRWSAVVTYREGQTRIISVRRPREEEVAVYEG
jgi:hypothetical protein